jgi:signal transduction histidine kinase
MRRLTHLWYRLLYTGTEEIREDDLRLGITKGINLFCLWIIVINIVSGPAYAIASGKPSVLYGSMVELLALAGVLHLNHRNRRTLANLSFYGILLAATFYFSVILGPVAEAQLMIVLMVGLAFFLFESGATRIRCTVVSVLLLVVMEINYRFHLIKVSEAPAGVAYAMRWTAYCVIISLVAILFYLFDKNYNKLLAKRLTQNKIVQGNLEEQTIISLRKSHLIRTSFHEIRSQFKGMKMILTVLSNNRAIIKIEGMQKTLGDLRNASETIEMVMGNLLNYSKGEAGIVEKPFYEHINLKLVLKVMIEINQYFANMKGIRIIYRTSDDVPEYLISDRFKINQIFTNLLHNAIKFSYANTSIILGVEKEVSNWKISINDEGVGISPEKLKNIFDPFVTDKNKENTEGIGLGLHITQQLVSVMNGRIEVESKQGAGSTFTVYLPIIQGLTDDGTSKEKDVDTAIAMQSESLN